MLVKHIVVDDWLQATRGSDSIDDLVKSIEEIGLLSPILVDSKLRLLSGLRRLEAFKRLGYCDIPAILVKKGAIQVELMEINKHLRRHMLGQAERDKLLLRRMEVYSEFIEDAERDSKEAEKELEYRRRSVPVTYE